MGQRFRYKPGQVVPGTDLKVIRPIGSGGMACVYEVEETSVEAPFVMKVLHPHLLLDNANHMAERMRQEAKTQARLNHKNIVRVYRAGVTAEVPPLPYYVMDALSGYSLQHVLRWHRSKGLVLPLSWAFWIASSLLTALEHAHRSGVIHRDVKPDNIFIHHPEGHRPVVKLIDFGIMAAAVSQMSNEVRLTGSGGFAGTYTHAAPEQLRGAVATPAMDIYAAGVVFYQLLAGRHPFDDSKDPEALAVAHLTQLPQPLSRYRDLHPKLERLVLRMLDKDPKGRPESARDTMNELARIKTEWMQQTTDVSLNDPAEFHFDVGERWPTNIDAEEDFTLDSVDAAPNRVRPNSPQNFQKRGPANFERPPVLGIPASDEPARGSVPSRATWGNTVGEAGQRSRKAVLALATGGLAILLGIGYAAWRPSAGYESAQAGPSVATSQHPEQLARSAAIQNPPSTLPIEALPATSTEQPMAVDRTPPATPPVPILKKSNAPGVDGGLAKRPTAPAKHAAQGQSPPISVPPVANDTAAAEDLMHP